MTKDAQKLLRHIIDGVKSQNSTTVKIDISKIENIPNIEFAQKKLLNELEAAGVISGYQENILGEVFVYLTSDGLEYFDDVRENKESSNIVFNVSGGQVNIANDKGSINAIINDKLCEKDTILESEYKENNQVSLSSNKKAEKVFISYSWTPDCNKKWVKQLVHKLESDGIEVVIDFKDLKLGHDKYAFMERTVNDDTIKKVLIICNRTYKEKADGRIGGVGDESAIITSQMYGNVRQEKFIPVVNEFDENGRPFLPNYLASRMYADLTDFEKGYEELLNNINEVNGQERVVDENNNFMYDIVISDIYDEIRKVLQGLEPNSKNRRYYFDYEILEEKGVIKIITDDLVNMDYDMKKNICQYLWKKTFIDAQKDIDFCYIYLLIDLFNNQKVRIKLSEEMQRLKKYDINGFYPDKIRYWHTSVEAMFYLLERCPQVYYEMLDDPLKAKLRIAAGRNLRYIVREFYLWDSTKKHIEHIKKQIKEKKEQEEPYVKSPKTNSPKCAIWYSEDLLFLYNSQKTESEKNEVVDFIMTLFRNCRYYDRASGLFEAVFYLLKQSVIKEEEIIDIVNKNSQIYGTKEYMDYLETLMKCASKKLNLEEYPNISKVFQDNYSDKSLYMANVWE